MATCGGLEATRKGCQSLPLGRYLMGLDFDLLRPSQRQLIEQRQLGRSSEQIREGDLVGERRPPCVSDQGLVHRALDQLALNLDAIVHSEMRFEFFV